MWRVSSALTGTCCYRNQRITYCGVIRASISEIYRNGKKVLSAYIGPNTRIIYRSDSSRLVFFIQMSAEMWHFEEQGHIVFHKMINSFFPELFKRWRNQDSHHVVTIILFTSVDISGNQNLQHGEVVQGTSDYFRVVVDQTDINNWNEIMEKLRYEFTRFDKDVLLQNDGKIVGHILPAVKGNILEAISIATKLVSGKFRDRDLRRTGVQALIITPGTGIFDVDYDLLYQTSAKLTNIEIGIDLVCLSRPPLHITPLFRYKDKKKNIVCHCVPSWLDISFWSSNERQGIQWIPRCKIYEIQMMGVMENEASSIMIDYLPPASKNKALEEVMEDYDRDVFRKSKPFKNGLLDNEELLTSAPALIIKPRQPTAALQTDIDTKPTTLISMPGKSAADAVSDTASITSGSELVKPRVSALTSLLSATRTVSSSSSSATTGSLSTAPNSPALSAIGSVKSTNTKEVRERKSFWAFPHKTSTSTLRSLYKSDDMDDHIQLPPAQKPMEPIQSFESGAPMHIKTTGFNGISSQPTSAISDLNLVNTTIGNNTNTTAISQNIHSPFMALSHMSSKPTTPVLSAQASSSSRKTPVLAPLTTTIPSINTIEQSHVMNTGASHSSGILSNLAPMVSHIPATTVNTVSNVAAVISNVKSSTIGALSKPGTSSSVSEHAAPSQLIDHAPNITGASVASGMSGISALSAAMSAMKAAGSAAAVPMGEPTTGKPSEEPAKPIFGSKHSLADNSKNGHTGGSLKDTTKNLGFDNLNSNDPSTISLLPPLPDILRNHFANIQTQAGAQVTQEPSVSVEPSDKKRNKSTISSLNVNQQTIAEPFGKITGPNRLNNIVRFPHSQAMPITRTRIKPVLPPPSLSSHYNATYQKPYGVSQRPYQESKNSLPNSETKEREEEHSMWMTIENPSNVPQNKVIDISNYGRWQFVYPRKIKRRTVKWRSLISPAALPLLTSNFPSLRQFQNDYSAQIYDATLYADKAEYSSTSELLNEMIAVRISMGFQIVAIDRVAYIESVRFFGNPNSVSETVQKDATGKRIYMSLGNQIHRISFESGMAINVQVYTKNESQKISADGKELTSLNAHPTERKYHPLVKTRFEDMYTPSTVKIFTTTNLFNWNQIDQILTGYEEYVLDDPRMYRVRLVLIPVDVPTNSIHRPFESSQDNLTAEEMRLEGLQKLSNWLNKEKYYTMEEKRSITNPKKVDASVYRIRFYTGKLSKFLLDMNDPEGNDGQPLTPKDRYRKNTLFVQHTERFTRSIRVSQLASELLSDRGIRFIDRRWHWKMHYHCFLGTELVIWMLDNFRDITTADEAVDYGNSLMQNGLFHHVENRHSFLNGHYFYQLNPEYDDQGSSSKYWFPGGSRRPNAGSGEQSLLKTRGRAPSSSSLKDMVHGHQRTGSLHDAPPPSPALLAQTKNSSPGLQGVQESASEIAGSRKPKVLLTRSMRYNVDPNGRSSRPEILTIHLDRVHNPENCFQLRLEWLNTTPKFIDEAIVNISRLTEQYGLKLVQVPLEEVTQIPRSNPFCSLFRTHMAIDPAEIANQSRLKSSPSLMQVSSTSSSAVNSNSSQAAGIPDSNIFSPANSTPTTSNNNSPATGPIASSSSGPSSTTPFTESVQNNIMVSSMETVTKMESNSTEIGADEEEGTKANDTESERKSNNSDDGGTYADESIINVIPEPLREDPLFYHKFVLLECDYFHDTGPISPSLTEHMDVEFSWGKPTHKYFQFVHKSGLCIAQVLEDGEFVLMINSIAVNRVETGPTQQRRREGPQSSSKPEDLLYQFKELCNNTEKLKILFDRATKFWLSNGRTETKFNTLV